MIEPRYSELLRAIASFRRHADADRLDVLEERFAFGIPDLEQVFETAVSGEPWLMPPLTPQQLPHAAGQYRTDSVSSDLARCSAVQIAQQVRSQALSPLEIAKLFLGRIQSASALNAFVSVAPERVMQESSELARRVAGGEDVGPLAGVPVAVKDLIPVRGYPLTAGTKAIDAEVQARDALCVARLRDAGAIVVGTTNLHELAFGVTSANPHFGHVQNPRIPGHVPGGSSGGSAAALAAGLTTLAIGSDTGGSIRQPAACCGIVGFKPTYGAIPIHDVVPLAWTLDHVGPMTRSVEDAALMFEVMAGLPVHTTLPRDCVMAPRIARPRRFFFDLLEDEVRSALDGALSRLAKAGAPIVECDIPGIELAPGIQLITIGSEASQSSGYLARSRGDQLGEDVRLRLEMGQFYLAVDYVKAQQLRRRVRDSMLAAFGDTDVMLVPAMPVLPPKSGTTTVKIDSRTLHVAPLLTRFTSPINFCGFPAISLPCATAKNGAAVNIQIVGRPGADSTVLTAARWCERVFGT